MRRMMLLAVAAIAACAAAIAVASPASSAVAPGPFVDDWFSSSASAWVGQDGFTYRQVVLVNADTKHMLTHMSTVQVYLLAPNITGPVVTKTVTLAWKGTFTYTVKTPTILQPVGIKILATHIKQANDPLGGVQPAQSSTAWYPHVP